STPKVFRRGFFNRLGFEISSLPCLTIAHSCSHCKGNSQNLHLLALPRVASIFLFFSSCRRDDLPNDSEILNLETMFGKFGKLDAFLCSAGRLRITVQRKKFVLKIVK